MREGRLESRGNEGEGDRRDVQRRWRKEMMEFRED